MKYQSPITVAVLLLGASMASADSLDVVRGNASWQPWQTPSVSGTAFWNNSSLDDNGRCNIGYWVSGTGGCAASGGTFLANSPRVTPSFLGDASTGFKFTKAADTQSVTVTSRVAATAYQDVNEVGWFDTTNPTVLNRLFAGIGPIGSSATFVPSGSYGFYLVAPEGTYLTTGTGDTRTHFAVFQLAANGRYIFGLEDMWVNSDRDFNDMVFEVQVANVPEPGSTVLDFEDPLPPGLSSVSFIQGTSVPSSARVTSQYLSQGVIIADAALVAAGLGHSASGVNSLAGINANGTLDYDQAVTFSFFKPGDSSTAGTTDYFAYSPDLWGESGNVVTITAFGLNGALLGQKQYTETGTFSALSISGFGQFHRVTVDQTLSDQSFGGIAIDLVEFGQITPVPEPAAYSLMLTGLATVVLAARRRRT